jgi:hypothetical protein
MVIHLDGHRPFNQALPPKQAWPVYDHRFLLAINPSTQRSPPQLGFSNPSPLSDGFENGPEFEVHYPSW